MQNRIFDFDGTLTYKDTFYSFITFRLTFYRCLLITIVYLLVASLLKLRLISNMFFKKILIALRFFGTRVDDWKRHCNDYSRTIGLSELGEFAKKIPQGNIVIVTASPVDYVKKIFLNATVHGLTVRENTFLSLRYLKVDYVPYGRKKADLLREIYSKSYLANSICYGDSASDLAMGKCCRLFRLCKNGKILKIVKTY
jgi:phosphoserine phosphatase